MEEIIDLNVKTMDEDTFNIDGTESSGIEFLMNDKVKPDYKDISLEKELEEFNDLGKVEEPTIGKSTSNYRETETFNFKKLDEINIENESSNVEYKKKEDFLKEKFDLLRKLELLESKGANEKNIQWIHH